MSESKTLSQIIPHVYALTDLPEAVKGAVFARYSRTHKDAATLIETEFTERSPDSFLNRVLVEYGDDSVAELAGAHVGVEGVSSLCADTLTGARVGLSPLEKSGRYVRFDNTPNDYVVPNELSATGRDLSKYHKVVGDLFQLYTDAFDAHLADLTAQHRPATPPERRAVHSAAADLVKNILPAARKTSVGLYGNFRAYEHLINKLCTGAQPAEFERVGRSMFDVLSEVAEPFTRRVRFGDPYLFASQVRAQRMPPAERLQAVSPWNIPMVRLITPHPNERLGALKSVASALNFENWGPYREFEDCSPDSLDALSDTIVEATKFRRNRRDKPHRGFEAVSATFEIVSTYGAYRDLRRHRIASRQRTHLGALYGWPTFRGNSKITARVEDTFKNAFKLSSDLRLSYPQKPSIAEYVIPRAAAVKWMLTANLRELIHIIELRSGPSGHAEYREIAKQLYNALYSIHPALVKEVFLDTSAPALGRLTAEERTESKLEVLASASASASTLP